MGDDEQADRMSRRVERSRIVSCDHNDADTIALAKRIVDAIPNGWSGILMPDGDGHAIAVLSEPAAGGELGMFSTESMLAITVQIALHDPEFAASLINKVMGDEVEYVEDDKTLH